MLLTTELFNSLKQEQMPINVLQPWSFLSVLFGLIVGLIIELSRLQ